MTAAVVAGVIAALVGALAYCRRLIDEVARKARLEVISEIGAEVHRAEIRAEAAEARAEAAHQLRREDARAAASRAAASTLQDEEDALLRARSGPGADVRDSIAGRGRRD